MATPPDHRIWEANSSHTGPVMGGTPDQPIPSKYIHMCSSSDARTMAADRYVAVRCEYVWAELHARLPGWKL